MRLEDLVARLDGYFRVAQVRGDDWSHGFEDCYPEPYWREYVEPGYESRWNGLMVRGAAEVERVATCVFPSDAIVGGLEPGTFLFSEHPLDFAEVTAFRPLARASFEGMRAAGISFYHVHAPLDMHPEVSPSRLIGTGLGLRRLEEYGPIADGIPGGACVIGESDGSLDELAARLQEVLGQEIPVEVVTRPREEAGRVAVVAGGGADVDLLEQSLARGCRTYVTGNSARPPEHPFFRRKFDEFRELAAGHSVALVDGTHYGTEKLPQLAMLTWFRRLGLEAVFRPDGPKLAR
ncbi:MAG: Nif3-like dinuclear metal center hexameric protein [Actinobacteria bacterium]|nr:Nif3-like dinuclear metal center hexameric protein [Actinomycetota bacterium]